MYGLLQNTYRSMWRLPIAPLTAIAAVGLLALVSVSACVDDDDPVIPSFDAAPPPPDPTGDGGIGVDAPDITNPPDAAVAPDCVRNEDCNDGIDCTADSCDTSAGKCVAQPNDDYCQTGGYCNGIEYCDSQSGCEFGDPPPLAPGVECISGQISAGKDHTCFILTNGESKCWGRGASGQLGYGNRDNIGDSSARLLADTPPLYFDGNVVVQMASGSEHSCVLLASGQVRCWGEGDNGRLGYGNTNDVDDVTEAGFVNLSGTATQITAGEAHTCALLSTGLVRCWGKNESGQLGYANGNNDIGDNETPAQAGFVPFGFENNNPNLPVRATQVVAGNAHTCAITTGTRIENRGLVRCWGSNDDGQIAPAESQIISGAGSLVRIGDDIENILDDSVVVTEIAAGANHTCALLNVGGIVRCWGQGTEGQLGHGNVANNDNIGDSQTDLPVPDVFVGGEDPISIAAGGNHTCALSRTGRVRCWGSNEFGQLGIYDRGPDNPRPDKVGDDELPSTIIGNVELIGEVVTQISVGGNHTCVIFDDGNMQCWGLAADGQLGYGNTNNVGDDESPQSTGYTPVR